MRPRRSRRGPAGARSRKSGTKQPLTQSRTWLPRPCAASSNPRGAAACFPRAAATRHSSNRKNHATVIPRSAATRNLSLSLKKGEIPRFARNDERQTGETMPITISLLPSNVDGSGSNLFYAIGTLAFSGNYATGGDTLDFTQFADNVPATQLIQGFSNSHKCNDDSYLAVSLSALLYQNHHSHNCL